MAKKSTSTYKFGSFLEQELGNVATVLLLDYSNKAFDCLDHILHHTPDLKCILLHYALFLYFVLKE